MIAFDNPEGGDVGGGGQGVIIILTEVVAEVLRSTAASLYWA